MDYYKILGVTKGACDSEIKAAFRKLALRYHPDRQVEGSAEAKAFASQQFRAISEAYDILSDPKKRAHYSSSGSRAHTYNQSAYSRQYNPGSYNTHSYTSQTIQQGGGLYRFFSAIARNSTRGDAIFHAGMASAFIATLLVAGSSGDFLWGHHNKGKLFEHMDLDSQPRKPSEQTSSAARAAAAAAKSSGREHLRQDDAEYRRSLGFKDSITDKDARLAPAGADSATSSSASQIKTNSPATPVASQSDDAGAPSEAKEGILSSVSQVLADQSSGSGNKNNHQSASALTGTESEQVPSPQSENSNDATPASNRASRSDVDSTGKTEQAGSKPDQIPAVSQSDIEERSKAGEAGSSAKEQTATNDAGQGSGSDQQMPVIDEKDKAESLSRLADILGTETTNTDSLLKEDSLNKLAELLNDDKALAQIAQMPEEAKRAKLDDLNAQISKIDSSRN